MLHDGCGRVSCERCAWVGTAPLRFLDPPGELFSVDFAAITALAPKNLRISASASRLDTETDRRDARDAFRVAEDEEVATFWSSGYLCIDEHNDQYDSIKVSALLGKLCKCHVQIIPIVFLLIFALAFLCRFW